MKKTPLDIVILIACLSRTETVNQRNSVRYHRLTEHAMVINTSSSQILHENISILQV